jgi:hypothetical protein
MKTMLPLAASVALCVSAAAQQTPLQPEPSHTNVPASGTNTPQIPDAPAISTYTPNVPTKDTGTPVVEPKRSAPTGLDTPFYFGPFRRPKVPPLFPGNGALLQSLVHDGKLYLTAHDASNATTSFFRTPITVARKAEAICAASTSPSRSRPTESAARAPHCSIPPRRTPTPSRPRLQI